VRQITVTGADMALRRRDHGADKVFTASFVSVQEKFA
jgi:hypothetical protein